MTKYIYYLWIVLLVLYIVSPLDALPHFFDDLIASGILLYLLYKNGGMKKREGYSQNYDHAQRGDTKRPAESLTLEDAYRFLGVSPDTPLKEVEKTYKERISKSHPDKVSHLGEELQEKASEVTLKLNAAMNTIRKNKN